MAYPAGVILRPVTFGPAFELEDGGDAGMTVAIKATRAGMLWRATGQPGISNTITASASDGLQQTLMLPVTDQVGWGDGDGNALIPGTDGHVFLYTVSVKYTQDGRDLPGGPRSKNVPIPTGDLSPLDLDDLISLTTPGGSSVAIPDIWSELIEQAQAAAVAAEASVADAAAVVTSTVTDDLASGTGPIAAEVSAKIETGVNGRKVSAALSRHQAAGNPVPMTTPTPDGSGQVTHPDAIFVPGGFAGHEYWMVYTPYPDMTDPLENPCIVCSDDGFNFAPPAGITNPIEPYPGGGNYNSDAILILSRDGLTMYCIFRQVIGGVERIVYKTSTDGVAWTPKVVLFSTGVLTGCLSPSVLWDGQRYVMHAIAGSAAPHKIQMRTAPAIEGPWSEPVDGTVTLPNTFSSLGTPAGLAQDPWHIDVIWHEGRYLGVVATKTLPTNGGGQLVLIESMDGLTWAASSHSLIYPSGVVVAPGAGGWDATFYRSSLMALPDGRLRIYYAGVTANNLTWRMGVTETYLDHYEAPDGRRTFGRVAARARGDLTLAQRTDDITPALSVEARAGAGNPAEMWSQIDELVASWNAIGGGWWTGGYPRNTASQKKAGSGGFGSNETCDFRGNVWVACSDTGNLYIGRGAEAGGGQRTLAIQNAAVVPTANASGGFVLWSHDGALRWRGMGGSVMTVAGETRSLNASTTLGLSDRNVLVTSGAGGVTITLPAATKGAEYVVKKIDNGAGAVTVATTSAQTIDGATTRSLAAQYDRIKVVSDGSAWYIV